MRISGVVVVLMAAAMQACGGTGDSGTGGGGGSSLGGGSGGGGGSGSGGGSGATCSALNCTGCCFNGACQPGITAAACGKNGAACSACQANQLCRVDQSCGVDPNSMWKVQPTAATIAPNNNGSTWDGDSSAPDVIVRLDCAPTGTSWDSSTAEVQSYSPTWATGGCTAKASDLLSGGFDLQLIDVDAVTDDTITGVLAASVREADFVSGRMTFNASGGLQSLTVTLQKQ